jgi:hypothetical protein
MEVSICDMELIEIIRDCLWQDAGLYFWRKKGAGYACSFWISLNALLRYQL